MIQLRNNFIISLLSFVLLVGVVIQNYSNLSTLINMVEEIQPEQEVKIKAFVLWETPCFQNSDVWDLSGTKILIKHKEKEYTTPSIPVDTPPPELV